MVWEVLALITKHFPMIFVRDDTEEHKREDLAALAKGFTQDTTGVLPGCVLSVDGMVVRIMCPRPSCARDPRRFYNRKGDSSPK